MKDTITRTVTLSLLGFVVLAWVAHVAGRELEAALKTIIRYSPAALGVVVFALAAVGITVGVEWYLDKRATRKAKEKENDLIIIKARADEQVYISDGRRRAATFAPAHLPADIDPFNALAWSKWNEYHSKPAPAMRLTGKAEASTVPQLGAGDMPDLLGVIAHMPNILIVGGKGTGKTTLMQWLAYRRAQSGKVLVFDSHDHPAKWPGADVIGNGRDYERIWEGMLALVGKLDLRYRDFSTGRRMTGEFGRIDNFIDEFTLLPKTLKDRLEANVQEYSWPLLTEGRKVDMNVVWGTHSDKVEALGLKGASDLKECFDAVVYLKNVNQDRYAMVDFGEGKNGLKYRLPGPFAFVAQPEPLPAGVEEIQPESVFVESAPVAPPEGPTDEDHAIMVAYYQAQQENGGKVVLKQVCEKLGWKPGGMQYDKIRAAMRKWTKEDL